MPEQFHNNAISSNGPILSAGLSFWRIYLDRFAPSSELLIIQAASLTRLDHYPIALFRDPEAKDVTLSIYLKSMGGTTERVKDGSGEPRTRLMIMLCSPTS